MYSLLRQRAIPADFGSILERSLGAVIGLSLSATVVQQSLRSQLRSRLSPGEDADRIIREVRQSLEYIKTLEPETRVIVRGCYEIAIRNGFGFILAVVSLAMLSSCALRNPYVMCTKANRQQGSSGRRSLANSGLLYCDLLSSVNRSIGLKNLFLLGRSRCMIAYLLSHRLDSYSRKVRIEYHR